MDEWRVLTMAYQDPNSRPQRAPGLNPLPLGANPPLYQDDDGGVTGVPASLSRQ
jgi:hypothetical protein